MNEATYLGNPNLKKANVQQNWTKKELQEYARCMEDPLYFIQTYVRIVSLDEGLIPFKMYPFQKEMVGTFHKNRFPQNEAGVETADTETHPSVSYSFIAYRQFQNDIVWIDELYTADCVRQQGVARWLVWQIGHRQRIELQVSTATTEQAEAARHSYTTMGLKPLSKRERSRVITGPDPGYEIWKTPEYNVTSGWSPLPHRDTQFHDTWSALTEVQRTALVHTMMHTHGYSEDKARRPPDGVTRPRRHRDTTSRHTTATLHAVERALRGTTDADGDSSGVT